MTKNKIIENFRNNLIFIEVQFRAQLLSGKPKGEAARIAVEFGCLPKGQTVQPCHEELLEKLANYLCRNVVFEARK